MHNFDAIALFCDDIREEKSGAQSLIGVMGDNVRVSGFPGALPKLAIHIRINVPVDATVDDIEIYITNPGEVQVKIHSIESTLINKTIKNAILQGSSIAGIYSNIIAAPFQTLRSGSISIHLKGKFGIKEIGILNILGPDDIFNSAGE